MKRCLFLVLEHTFHILAIMIVCAFMIVASMSVGHARGIESGVKKIEATPSSSSWRIFSSPNVGVQNNLVAVAAFSQLDAWAVGSDVQLNARSVQEFYPLIEHWDGKVWSVVSGGLPKGRQGLLVGVAEIAPQDVWTIGNYINGRTGLFIEHWNGVQWSMIGAPVAGTLQGITAIATNDVWVVGSTTAGDQGLTEHWNGKKWSQVPTPMPLPVDAYQPNKVYLNAVSGLSSNDVWLVGAYDTTTPGLGKVPLIEHWDGSKWTIVTSQYYGRDGDRVDNWLYSITEIAPNDIWAVGTYSGLHGNYNDYVLIEHWDGTQWALVPNPLLQTGYPTLLGVAANATNDVWAVGTNNDRVTIIEHWDGGKWKQATSPNPGNYQQLEAMTHIPGTHHFWAVGSVGGDMSNTLIVQH